MTIDRGHLGDLPCFHDRHSPAARKLPASKVVQHEAATHLRAHSADRPTNDAGLLTNVADNVTILVFLHLSQQSAWSRASSQHCHHRAWPEMR